MAPTTRTALSSTTTTSHATPIAPHTASSSLPPNAHPASILFICLGNICRSTLAEATFRALTAHCTSTPHPLISRIDSCGTGAYHVSAPPDSRTLSVLREKAGITDYTHRARKIRVPDDLVAFDYLVVMDRENLDDVRDLVKRAEKKGVVKGNIGRVCLYGEFGGREKGEEVGDPYYGGREGFEVAYEQVLRCGRGLLQEIEGKAMKRVEGGE